MLPTGPACPIAAATSPLGALSVYNSTDYFTHAAMIWKPMKRVSVVLGYGGSFVRGNTIFLNPLTPSGTLDYNYQRPYASIAIDIFRGFTYKMSWNYYGFTQAGNTSPFGLALFSQRTLTAAMPHSRSVMRFERCTRRRR